MQVNDADFSGSRDKSSKRDWHEWHFLSRKLLEERKLGAKMANIAI
jgi:hypothetical protein